jgi:hypothetical protein
MYMADKKQSENMPAEWWVISKYSRAAYVYQCFIEKFAQQTDILNKCTTSQVGEVR